MRLKTQVLNAFFEREATGLSKRVRLVRHATARSAYIHLWKSRSKQSEEAGEGAFFSMKELKRQVLEGDMTFEETVACYEDMKVFAYANQQAMRVHLWFASDIPRLRLIAVLAHELGHLAEALPVQRNYLGARQWRREWNADTYGEAAVIATIWADKLLGTSDGGKCNENG